MKITKLNFKNFMGYKQLNLPDGEDDFPEGLILVSGKNSYGKSSILEGILFAFFGSKIFTGRNAESFSFRDSIGPCAHSLPIWD